MISSHQTKEEKGEGEEKRLDGRRLATAAFVWN